MTCAVSHYYKLVCGAFFFKSVSGTNQWYKISVLVLCASTLLLASGYPT